MDVKQAKNKDEVWLLDKLEKAGVEDQSFRSRDYVIAYTDDGEPCGAGRIRYKTEETAQLDNLISFEPYQGKSPIPSIVEKLAEKSKKENVTKLYHTNPPKQLDKFPSSKTNPKDLDLSEKEKIYVYEIENILKNNVKNNDVEEIAKEFGYNEKTTTKYST